MASIIKNLVLGTAKGFNVDELSLFVKSFRKFNKKDDVVLIVSEIDKDVSEFLKKHDVETILSSIMGTCFCLGITRFFVYHDFLLKDETFKCYSKILLTDVSDVVFQGDPFEDTPGDFLYFGEEDHNSSIGNSSWNSFWIKECFGEEILQEMKSRKIVCAGTTIGSSERMLNYLKTMTRIMREILEKKSSLHAHYIDQGVHNYISFKNLVEHEIKPIGHHMASIGETIMLNPLAIFVNPESIMVYEIVPKLVHQYNRSHQLTHFYENLYK